jgi:hypothetical protein
VGSSHLLLPSEQRLAQFLAQERHAARRSAGAPNGRRNPAGDVATDLEGIAAELAFCRLHNVYPDVTIGACPEEDALLPGGWRVDVKTTRYTTGSLLVMPNKQGHSSIDLFALMVGAFPGPYRFAGFLPSCEIVRPERMSTRGHGPTYAAEQSELVGFEAAVSCLRVVAALMEIEEESHGADRPGEGRRDHVRVGLEAAQGGDQAVR